jgi:DNA-binding CsgD family transcriptional regulator
MIAADALHRGREAFLRQAWGDAYAQLRAAELDATLELEDLERLAVASYLIGRDEDAFDAWARAANASSRVGADDRAALYAFWLGFSLLFKGEMGRSGGWLGRAQRLVDDGRRDCVARGFLLIPAALLSMGQGDATNAYSQFSEAAEVGRRYGDPDLVAFGRLGRGQALIRLGRTAGGVALLDEVMIAVTRGEVSSITAGIVYCAVLLECRNVFDLGRAQEWTAALSRWCESQPDLVPYRGQCLVHRAEILQFHGEWPLALDEARLACQRLSGHPARGLAHYQEAEIHRLRGHFDEAEAAYRAANEWGREPQPGLALLRLAQGRTDAAEASIYRVMSQAQDRLARSKVLAAYVEILLAAGEVSAAHVGADDLSQIAADFGAPVLNAASAQATGSVLLAEGESAAASAILRRALTIWRELEAPYDAARVRVLVGCALRTLGDDDTAEMELGAARQVFLQLGAAPDLARVDALSASARPPVVGGLTRRELEVLALVATGKTNREIAAALVISEHTVRRHLQNTFSKLGVSSRAAATAFAFRHHLV